MYRTILASLLAIVLLAQPVLAAPDVKKQEPAAASKVILEWQEFKQITGWDPNAAPGNYMLLPWKEVLDLLGMEIQGVNDAKVSISWQEFKRLVEWSHSERQGVPETEKPPTPYIIPSAAYKGTASKDGLRVTLDMTIDVLQKDGWKRIPILPANVAIEQVTLPEGCFLNIQGGYYQVLTQKSGKIGLSVQFAVAVGENRGVFSGSFNRVASAAGTLSMKLEEKDAKLTVQGAQTTKTDGDTVTAALPSSGAIAISWQRAIKETLVAAKIYAESQTLVSVAEGVIIGRQNVRFSILHNKVDGFSFQLPKGARVLSVTGSNIRDWRTEGDALKIDLSYPHIGAWNAVITTEKAVGKDAAAEVPILKASGIEREKGFAVVVAVSNVEINTASMKGASAIDVRELPATLVGMTNQPILFSYRYASKDFSIQLGIRKHEDVAVLRTAVDSASAMMIQTEDGIVLTNFLMNVRNSRNQFLKLKLPKDSEIWSSLVAGKAVNPAKAADGTLLIPLVRSGSGSGHTAFPVEITYVTRGETLSVTQEKKLKLELPRLVSPITQYMVTLYMPQDFRLPKDREDYHGPLRFVKRFMSLSAGPQSARTSAEDNAERIRQVQQQQAQRAAANQGVQAISVKLPVHGKPYFFEKILVLAEDLWVEFEYEYEGD